MFHLGFDGQGVDRRNGTSESCTHTVCHSLLDFLGWIHIGRAYQAGINRVHRHTNDRCRHIVIRSDPHGDTSVHGGPSWPLTALPTMGGNTCRMHGWMHFGLIPGSCSHSDTRARRRHTFPPIAKTPLRLSTIAVSRTGRVYREFIPFSIVLVVHPFGA